MCRRYLLDIYRAFYERGRVRICTVERWVALEGDLRPLSEDERRNERETYADLFSDECRADVEFLYQTAMREMRGKPYELSGGVLEALDFLQQVVATALWKYRSSVGETLESFAREFDRLDVEDERRRLHALAQDSMRDAR
jgi:hypothetical protein